MLPASRVKTPQLCMPFGSVVLQMCCAAVNLLTVSQANTAQLCSCQIDSSTPHLQHKTVGRHGDLCCFASKAELFAASCFQLVSVAAQPLEHTV
jgi:hypothetical protein